LLGDGGEVRQHRYSPGCGDVQQVVGARVGDDPAALVSHHIVGVGVVRRSPGIVPRLVRRLRVSGRESGDIDNLGLPARDQPQTVSITYVTPSGSKASASLKLISGTPK
jgi:hypothetical protein